MYQDFNRKLRIRGCKYNTDFQNKLTAHFKKRFCSTGPAANKIFAHPRRFIIFNLTGTNKNYGPNGKRKPNAHKKYVLQRRNLQVENVY